MVDEFLGEPGVRGRVLGRPAVPQTFSMAGLLNEVQEVEHPSTVPRPLHHHPATVDGQSRGRGNVCM